jgi:hypothetical protein
MIENCWLLLKNSLQKRIKLILALHPWLRHSGCHSSPGFRHTKTRLFSPTMILRSSENITRLQSLSTVQYLFPRAQARRPLTFTSRNLIFLRTTRLWKLFTFILNSRLNFFANDLNIISENQDGFRKGYSIEYYIQSSLNICM